MADETLQHEEHPVDGASDDAASEVSHVPEGDEGDVLEEDEGVAGDELHPLTETDESASDDGVHGLPHEHELDEAAVVDEAHAAPPHEEPAPGPAKNWYIIHAYSGFENKVAESLRTRAQAFGFADRVGQLLIPTEEVIELRNGKKVTSKRLLYPGYVLVEMEMDDELWHAVKSTPRVTGFVGGGTKPVPLTADEVNSVLYRQASSAERPRPKMTFEKNETVKIVDGPFTNFSGKVDEVNTERNTLRVMVTIFGRSTPVELDFLQVEKI